MPTESSTQSRRFRHGADEDALNSGRFAQLTIGIQVLFGRLLSRAEQRLFRVCFDFVFLLWRSELTS
jgi:hypothetical protein